MPQKAATLAIVGAASVVASCGLAAERAGGLGASGDGGAGTRPKDGSGDVEDASPGSETPVAEDSAPGDAAPVGSSLQPPSCAPGGPGLMNCGAASESCCTSLAVTGGSYYRTYDSVGLEEDGGYGDTAILAADGGPTSEADPATVSSFRLDKYDVTVGRFRQFVAAWNGGWTPAAGTGKHTHLHGGLGLANSAGGYEPGWVAADDSNILPTDANLACDPMFATWTSAVGSQENLPIDCVDWYESYAFCIWDGGFLPSEAEWEYAAAGGGQQREYPWGTSDPGSANQYAIYGDGEGHCDWPTGALAPCTGIANIAPVGSATLGVGLWGQLDLTGNMWQWNADWYAAYADPCVDCADLTANSFRVVRGGLFNYVALFLLSPSRNFDLPSDRYGLIGVRCARSP
jgi:formylglycine-generating enzyme required for sulfatase activity